ncbi:putative inactive protein kinase [Vitis vinifera]|uniref:Putative inactive protein kinase n=1 Tax=Vitis vinifera TaxID=29760 RepID=A0A438KHR7_VITVI|nr:putative inactive protein kinase [Vitis vinifera]
MLGCKPADTSMDPTTKLGAKENCAPMDKGRYQRLVEHMEAVYRILRYLKLTPGKGLFFEKNQRRDIEVFSDADWARSVQDRRSTSGYCTYVWGNLVTWRSKKQSVVSRSRAEAEFWAMAHDICEGIWLRRVLKELKISDEEPMKMFCDNQSTISIAKNPVHHDRTKHVEIDRHFIKDKIEEGIIKMLYVPTSLQTTDILTKALPRKDRDGFNVFAIFRLHDVRTSKGYVERGTAVYLSGLREKYFGEIFLNASTCLGGSLSAEVSSPFFSESNSNLYDLIEMNKSVIHEIGSTSNLEDIFLNKFRTRRVVYEEGLDHIARYIESFESQSNEIWLVFRHEGVSLSKLMYTVEEVENNVDEGRDEKVNHIQVLHPSKWWRWLKTTEAGQEEMRNLIRQLLMALKSCHDRNITHRDIKPENMVICFEDRDTGRCMKGTPSEDKKYTTKMRIIDFGSAIDEFTLKHLYASVGPSRAEQTYEYAPPEAFLNASWYKGLTSTTLKYDTWSVGVVFLELILGSPNVFQINALTRALLDQHLKGWNEELKELAYK